MGGDKHRAVLGQRSLLEHVIARVEAQAEALALSGDHVSLAESGHLVLPDYAHLSGPSAGLMSALQWACQRAQALLTVPCDMPFLPVTLASDLAGGSVTVPVLDTRPIWTIAYWPQPCLAEGLAFFDSLDAGAAPPLCAVYEALSVRLMDVADAQAFTGINTPSALEEAEQSCA